jgi:hypothetical protein
MKSDPTIPFLSGCCLVCLLIIMVACSSDPAPAPNRSRVPQMSDYVSQAQQSAKDAQAAADKAAQSQKDIDTAVAKLNGVQRDSDGNLKEGRPETTAAGNIVEFSKPDYLSFLFIEKTGFSKRFYPVCDGQALPANRTVSLNYHWRSAVGQINGCYAIDSFTIIQ